MHTLERLPKVREAFEKRDSIDQIIQPIYRFDVPRNTDGGPPCGRTFLRCSRSCTPRCLTIRNWIWLPSGFRASANTALVNVMVDPLVRSSGTRNQTMCR
jgi:hypothetical protein